MKTLTTNQAVLAHEGLVLFTAPWCGPCKSYKPALEAFATSSDIELAAVDIDESRDLAGLFNIRAVPTTLFVKGGEVVRRVTGAQTAAQLLRLVA